MFLKYKWWILVWGVYAFWVFVGLSDYHYRLDTEETWLWVFWTIIVPIIICLIYNLYKYFKGKRNGNSYSKNNAYTGSGNTVITYKGSMWHLVEFAKEHGKLQMQSDNGNMWCKFRFADGVEGYVASVLKNYSAEDIKNSKERISIRILESGDYCMCLDWEDIDI